MGKYAVDLLNEKLGTEFTEDEAGSVSYTHLVKISARRALQRSL